MLLLTDYSWALCLHQKAIERMVSKLCLCVQLTNTVVFFFSGAACLNFFVRSVAALESDGYSAALAVTFWRLPIIFVFVMIVRLLLIMLLAPPLGVFGYSMDWRVRSSSPPVLLPIPNPT